MVRLLALQTQRNVIEKVVVNLTKHFSVYAIDYPGRGYSDAL